MHGKIGDKNNYHKHLHMYLSKAQFYNLSRFRLGAWKLNVNDINLNFPSPRSEPREVIEVGKSKGRLTINYYLNNY